jgi:hypothetical protein
VLFVRFVCCTGLLQTSSDAAKVHLRIASFLESENSGNLRPIYAQLSYHFEKGAVGPMAEQFTREAFKYAVKASDEAIARGAYTDGLTMCRKAYSLLTNLPECEVLLELIDLAISDLKPPGVVTNLVRRVSVQLVPGAKDEKSSSFTLSRNAMGDNGGLLKMYVKMREMINRQSLTLQAQMGTPKKSFIPNPFGKQDLMMGADGNRVAKLSWKATYTKEKHLAWYQCSCCQPSDVDHDGRR